MFGLPLPPWLSPTLIGAVGIAVLAFGGGMWFEGKLDAPALAKSQAETAKVNSDYSAYQARIAAGAAKADADALAQKQAQEASQAALQAKLAQAQKEANANSQKLKDLLDKAAPQDIRPLGPSALAYFAGLRQLQSASPTPNH